MGLADALEAAKPPRRLAGLRKVFAALPEKEQQVLLDALRNEEITNRQIAQALTAEGYPISEQVVKVGRYEYR